MSTPTLPAVDLGRVLPPVARKVIYAAFVIALVLAFGLDLGYDNNPDWLEAALRVLGGLTPIGFALATINVPTGDVVLEGSPATLVPTTNAERERAREARVQTRDGDTVDGVLPTNSAIDPHND